MERIEDCRSLPTDIWFEILLRLPFKKLIKLKLVCRSWHDLITDRLFTSKHPDDLVPKFVFKKYPLDPLESRSVNCLSLDLDDEDDVQVQVSRLADPVIDGDVDRFFEIQDSCGGLLLITLFHPNELCLYDPVTGACEVLPDHGYGYLCSGWDWKIVNDTSTDRYTVIGLSTIPCKDVTGLPPGPKCLLLDHSSDSWKELAVPQGTNRGPIKARGARRNGKVYWLIEVQAKRFCRSYTLETGLLSFDPADLQIRYKPCSPMAVETHWWDRKRMFEYDGAFYLTHHPWHKHYGMELWVLRDLDSRRPVWLKQHVTSNGLLSGEQFTPVAVLQGSNKIISITYWSKEIAVYNMISQEWILIHPEVDEETDEHKWEWKWDWAFIPHKIA